MSSSAYVNSSETGIVNSSEKKTSIETIIVNSSET